jgi:hypothetical protein
MNNTLSELLLHFTKSAFEYHINYSFQIKKCFLKNEYFKLTIDSSLVESFNIFASLAANLLYRSTHRAPLHS